MGTFLAYACLEQARCSERITIITYYTEAE